MKKYLATFVFLIPVLLLAQQAEDSVDSLIRKLTSANFAQRQKASEALKKRPEAVPALLEALRSGDLEMRTRAREILNYHDRGPLRELETLAKAGEVEKFTLAAAKWPKGKYEQEVWSMTRGLVYRLKDLHEKKGGEK